MLSKSPVEKSPRASLGILSGTLLTGLLCLLILWATKPQTAAVLDYAFAANRLAERAGSVAEQGSLPRANNEETKELLLALSDAQTFLFSSAISNPEKTAICYIARGAVQLYTYGLPGTQTESREASTHETIVARTAEYIDELILLKPFLTDCHGEMMSMILEVPSHMYKDMNEKTRSSIQVIRSMALSDLIGTLAAANEPSLPLAYRLVTLQSMVRNASLLARTVPREERVRIAGMVDEVIERANATLREELVQIKQQYLSITDCEPACQALG